MEQFILISCSFAGFVFGAYMMWRNMRQEISALKDKLSEAKSANALLWRGNKVIYDSYQEELRRKHA